MTEAKSAQPQLPPLKDNRDWQWDSGGSYGGALKIVLSQLAERERQLLTALAENESLKAKFDAHVKAVGRFLNDMYATMIDPVEDWQGSVSELCDQLLKVARDSREQAAERDKALEGQ